MKPQLEILFDLWYIIIRILQNLTLGYFRHSIIIKMIILKMIIVIIIVIKYQCKQM